VIQPLPDAFIEGEPIAMPAGIVGLKPRDVDDNDNPGFLVGSLPKKS